MALTGSALWDRAARFWTRIFAITFLTGVATGIVMEFEFGTNWARYSAFVGDVFGAPLAAGGTSLASSSTTSFALIRTCGRFAEKKTRFRRQDRSRRRGASGGDV